MKRSLCLPAMVCLVLFANAQTQGLDWIKELTWQQIKGKAKAENKFIFVDAYATWCLPCKKMDEEVYASKQAGDALNPLFLSVRVQMDQTINDNGYVKSWYNQAQQLNQQYSIDGYPSFLFFSPDGDLVHKALGYRDVTGFIELANDALKDPETKYKGGIERYRKKQLDYMSMPDLAREARKRKDKQTALEIVKEFRQNYLDKLNDQEVFTSQNLLLIADFPWEMMSPGDRYFNYFYLQPDIADSLMKVKKSRHVIASVIQKEEVLDKIYKDGKPIAFFEPDWKDYQKSIKRKYGKEFVEAWFPDLQITYYSLVGDWKSYIKYVNEKIKKVPPQKNGNRFNSWGDASGLNRHAWLLFKNCGDKKLLSKALKWVDLALELDNSPVSTNYIDTKANILYRMNRVEEAIMLQEKAVLHASLYNFTTSAITDNLRKMKAGLPTWPTSNGVNN